MLQTVIIFYGWITLDFPSGSVVKNPAANAGVTGSIPGLGRSPGEGNDNSEEGA